ncbi:MAG: class I SAM-dependent methyltransferase [Chloroflexi bacterium]|nr:class I SAM-dependent methyltransferase [Chloroflexota bacterium]
MTTAKPYSYDDMPYPSRAKPETRPAHMGALAVLHGMQPAPAESCRVLELGCSDGGNLIPLAYAYPHSTFVGVDLGAGQIAQGAHFADELGLRNVTLQHADIAALGADLGPFDYIIAHGVLSWVPRSIQDAILRLCETMLSPQGVAFLSYNAYPGWHMRTMVREMMQHHARDAESLRDRTARGREMLAYLAAATESLRGKTSPTLDYDSYSRAILKEQEIQSGFGDWYIAHEFFESHNEPFYFRDIVERAGAHGLQFLCEARFSEMSYAHYPKGVTEPLEQFAGGDIIEREQYLDFLRLRTFRQTLLCRSNIALERTPRTEWVRSLHIGSQAQPLSESPDLASKQVERFRGPSGTTMTVTNPLGKAAMLRLCNAWPRTVPFDELHDTARHMLNPRAPAVQAKAQQAQEQQFLADMLYKAFAIDMVEVSSAPAPVAPAIDDRPLASALARAQSARGKSVVNLRHESVDLDDEVTHRLLGCLDGTRDRTALLHEMATLAADGVLVVERNGRPIEDEDDYMRALDEALALHVSRIHNAALLVPQPAVRRTTKREPQ